MTIIVCCEKRMMADGLARYGAEFQSDVSTFNGNKLQLVSDKHPEYETLSGEKHTIVGVGNSGSTVSSTLFINDPHELLREFGLITIKEGEHTHPLKYLDFNGSGCIELVFMLTNGQFVTMYHNGKTLLVSPPMDYCVIGSGMDRFQGLMRLLSPNSKDIASVTAVLKLLVNRDFNTVGGGMTQMYEGVISDMDKRLTDSEADIIRNGFKTRLEGYAGITLDEPETKPKGKSKDKGGK